MSAEIGIVGPNGFLGKSISAYLRSTSHPFEPIDREKLRSIIENSTSKYLAQFDYIIWLASSVNPHSAEHRNDLIEQDLLDLAAFMDCLKLASLKKPTKIIFVSSGGCVYSDVEPPFTEESTATGSNQYGIYKRAAEEVIEDSGIPFAIVRASNIYGPNQPVGRGQGVIAEWIESARNLKPLKVFGSLENTRDFLFIDDFIFALEAIMLKGFTGIVNIGAGEPTSLKKVLETIKQLAKTDLYFENYPNRGIDRREYFLDTTKAKIKLGWEPTISIEVGIETSLTHHL